MTGLPVRRSLALAAGAIALTLAVALPTASISAPAAHSAQAACGAATLATVTAVDESVAKQIYRGELGSPEVYADRAHITGAADLLRAVAAGDVAATTSAVTRIVFTPHWHIVRLRVLSAGGTLLADVGGPDILSPVSGKLVLNGTVVGSYVMSVQDDVGYEKLVTRFIGVPFELYSDGQPLLGTIAAPPPAPPASGAQLTISGVDYTALAYPVNRFPTGTLRAVLAIPQPAAALATRSCARVRVASFGAVFENIAAQFQHLASQYASYVETTRSFGGGEVFVRDGGVQLAGTETPGPASIPRGGELSYAGHSWLVFSFSPLPPTRIYHLLPASG